MGYYKLPVEMIADKKSRIRTFRTRENGLKKKLSELCTLCDIKACMVIYGPDGDGPRSSQPRFWPENRSEVECIVKEYIDKRKEEPGKRSLNLSDVLEMGKKRADLKPPILQGKNCQLDKSSYHELVQFIGELDEKLQQVESLMDLKKREANSMHEPTVPSSHIQASCVIQPLSSHVPMQGIQSIDSDQGTGNGTEEDDLGSLINSMLMMQPDVLDFTMKSMGMPESVDFMVNTHVSRQGIQSVDSDQGTGTGTVGDDSDSMINSMLIMQPDVLDFTMKSMCMPKSVDFMINSHVPMQGIQSVDSDQGTRTGTVGDDLDSMINSMLMMQPDALDFTVKSMGAPDADDLDSLANLRM